PTSIALIDFFFEGMRYGQRSSADYRSASGRCWRRCREYKAKVAARDRRQPARRNQPAETAVCLDGLAAAACGNAWRRTAGGECLARHAFGTYFAAYRNRRRAGADRPRRAGMDWLATVVSTCRG